MVLTRKAGEGDRRNGGGGGGGKRNLLEDAFKARGLQNVRGLEAQNFNTLFFQSKIAALVVPSLFWAVVISSLDFDAEPCCGAIEIVNVPYGMLAAKTKLPRR